MCFHYLNNYFLSSYPSLRHTTSDFPEPGLHAIYHNSLNPGVYQFLIHITVHFCGAYVVNFYTRIWQCWKIYKSQYKHHSLVPLATQQANHLIVEGYEALKAWCFSSINPCCLFPLLAASCNKEEWETKEKMTLAEYLRGDFPSWALSCFKSQIILKCLKRNMLSSFCCQPRVISVRYSEIICNNNR